MNYHRILSIVKGRIASHANIRRSDVKVGKSLSDFYLTQTARFALAGDLTTAFVDYGEPIPAPGLSGNFTQGAGSVRAVTRRIALRFGLPEGA